MEQDSPQKVAPKVKRSFAQWAISILVLIFLYTIKGIVDYKLGFKYGGGAILTAVTTGAIWAIACTIFYSPIFKSNIDRKKFKISLLLSIILLFISYLMCSGAYEFKFSKLNTLEEPIDRIHRIAEDLQKKSEPLPQKEININNEIKDIDDNIQKIKRKIPTKNTNDKLHNPIILNKPSIQFNEFLKQPETITRHNLWEYRLVDNMSMLVTGTSNKYIALFQWVFEKNRSDLIIVFIGKNFTAQKGTGFFEIDDKFYPIKYNILPFDEVTAEIVVYGFKNKPIEILEAMRRGKILNVELPSLDINMIFSLKGFTAASNDLLKWMKKNR